LHKRNTFNIILKWRLLFGEGRKNFLLLLSQLFLLRYNTFCLKRVHVWFIFLINIKFSIMGFYYMLIYLYQLKGNLHFPGCMWSWRIMGRKVGTLFINPKRFGSLHKPCMKEMAMFLNCMAANQSDMEACARQKELLNACMDSQVT